ncbi:MAG: FIG01001968: hypothetical protein, partial [uncultured Actinomycetospora sp.]
WHTYDASTTSASPSRTSPRPRRSSSDWASRSRAPAPWRASSWRPCAPSRARAARSRCCGRPTGGAAWSSRASSRPTTCPGRPPRCPTSSACATCRSRSATSTRSSRSWRGTGTGSSAASASTRAACGWPTCGGPKGSSCPCSSRSA